MDERVKGILQMPKNGGIGEMRKPLVAIENWAVVDSVLSPAFRSCGRGNI